MNKIITYIVVFISSLIFAQNKDKELYNGTVSYGEKKYVEAESDFRISESKTQVQKAAADYNLGNSIYRQNNPGEAKYKFSNAIEKATTKEQKHKAFHNLGNVFMKEENYQGAVNAYKNALRNNPFDEETRYNYALAKQKLKENPPQGNDNKDKKGGNDNKDQQNQNQNQDKDKGDNKDKGNNKDKKDSDKGEDKKENPNDGNDKKGQGKGNDKEDQNQPQPKPSGANKQQIQNLLEAVNNAEKKIQDKLNAKKVKVQPSTNDKDW